MKTDILVITALALEFQAVERLLTQSEPVKHPLTGARYKRGLFRTGPSDFTVAVVEAGAGNVQAAGETERALTFFQPTFVFFVGVGGGIKDVGIGDVVISSEVLHYEGGKAGDVYKPRISSYAADYTLVSLAKQVARDAAWQQRIFDNKRNYKAEVKPIAAGEKVVASEQSAIYQLLTQSVSQALAVEMEGYGFLAPIHAHHGRGLVIRGISDLLRDKAAADAEGSQPLAARNAAAFLAQMLTELASDLDSVQLAVNPVRSDVTTAQSSRKDGKPTSKRIMGEITNLRSGKRYSSVILCKGKVYNVPDGIELILAVEVKTFPPFTDKKEGEWRIWPKENVLDLDEDGNWKATINHQSKSPGESFNVSLWALPPEAYQQVQTWLEDGRRKSEDDQDRFKGLTWLNPGGERLHSVADLIYK